MMNVSQVTAYITVLCEVFLANIALERSVARMRAEVINHVTTFFKKIVAVSTQTAFIELLDPSGDRVGDLDYLVPVSRDLLKFIRF